MTRFRASDERLDREIETLEIMARTRLRRAAADIRGIERDLADLRRERTRRRAVADGTPYESADVSAES